MSRFTQFLDIAGRSSRSDASQYLVAAAVAFPTDELPTIAAAYTPPASKWVAASPGEASSQLQFLLRTCTAAVVFRAKKTAPAWADFWKKSDSYHSQMVRVNQRAVGFVKAGTLLKYWLFPGLNQLAIDVEQDNKVAVVDHSFDIAYDSIFGSTGLGRQLWPAEPAD